jgi:hypothetical protein
VGVPQRLGGRPGGRGRAGADEDPDAAWRAALIDRYANARRFRPYLLEVLDFHATEGGREVLRVFMAVPVLLAAATSPLARCPWGGARRMAAAGAHQP